MRTAVWFQGCSIRCTGCINPHLFSPRGGYIVDPVEVVNGARERDVEGLTLLGGEPFDQPGAGAALALAAQRAGLGVITFSGYVYEDLEARMDAAALLSGTDLLIDGPYRADQAEMERALVGSTNQRFVHLSDRYTDYDPAQAINRVELRVGPDGSVEVAGFLDRTGLQELAVGLGSQRVWKRGSGSG
nr:4Fe-4S cluster-binding domain-containing protein [Sinomonas mesophila]